MPTTNDNSDAAAGAPISHNSTTAGVLQEGAAISYTSTRVERERVDPYGPLSQLTFVPAPTPGRRGSRTPSMNGDDNKSVKCNWSDDAKVVCFGDLMQKPVVRQWLIDGRLFREAEERAPSRFELFFDLLLVGVVHQLAETAAESVSGVSVAKVVLTFYPAWTLWADLRNFMNSSGVDDVAQRVHTLILMICVLGYSANASAIEVGTQAAAMTSEVVHQVTSEDGVTEDHGPQRALVAAVAFFLVAKLSRILILIQYAWELPDFRSALLSRAVGLTVVALVFMGIIWAPTLVAAAILASVGIAVDIIGRLSVGIFVTLERRKMRHRARILSERQEVLGDTSDFSELPQDSAASKKHKALMIPALNIEHFIERNGGFVIVVLGESVVSLLYVASRGSYGLSREFGRATFALIVPFIFNAVYFDAALSKRFVHAIRRHWSTNVIWDMLHYPLCCALILASAAVTKMVTEEEVPRGVRWQYGAGLGVALFCITSAGLTHRSLDAKGASRLNQLGRAIFRYMIAVVFTLIPLVDKISTISFLATYAGVASAMVVFELWAKIGREEEDEEEDHTAVDADAADEREEELREAAIRAQKDQ